MKTNTLAPTSSVGQTWFTRAIPLLIPALLASIIYLVVAVVMMPLRVQYKIPATPIFSGNGIAWFDVMMVCLLLCVLTLIFAKSGLKQLTKVGQIRGQSKSQVMGSIFLTPTHEFFGKFVWQSFAAVAWDGPSGGRNIRLRLPMLAIVFVGELLMHCFVAVLTTALYSLPLLITSAYGAPITMPCFILDRLADRSGLLRVTCNPLSGSHLWDWDAWYFSIVICAIWWIFDTCLGFAAIRKTRLELATYSG